MVSRYLVPAILLIVISSIVGTLYLAGLFPFNNSTSQITVFKLDEDGNLVKEGSISISGVEEVDSILIASKAIPESLEEAFTLSDLVAEIKIIDISIVKVPRSTSEIPGYIGYIIYKAEIVQAFKGGYSEGDTIHLIALGNVDISNSILYTYGELPFFEVGDRAIIFAKKMNPFPGDVNGRLLVKNFPDLYEVPLVGFRIQDGKLSLLSFMSPGSDYEGMDVNQFKEKVLPSIMS